MTIQYILALFLFLIFSPTLWAELSDSHVYKLPLPPTPNDHPKAQQQMRACGAPASVWGQHNIQTVRAEIKNEGGVYFLSCTVICRPSYIYNLNKIQSKENLINESLKTCLAQSEINRQIQILTLGLLDGERPDCSGMPPMEQELHRSALELHLFTRFRYNGRRLGERERLNEPVNADERRFILSQTQEYLAGFETQHAHILKSYVFELLADALGKKDIEQFKSIVKEALSATKSVEVAQDLYLHMRDVIFSASSGNTPLRGLFNQARIELLESPEFRNSIANGQLTQNKKEFYGTVLADTLNAEQLDAENFSKILSSGLQANDGNLREIYRAGITAHYQNAPAHRRSRVISTVQELMDKATDDGQKRSLKRFYDTLKQAN